MWHDSILVSKVRSLQPSQGGSKTLNGLHHGTATKPEAIDSNEATLPQIHGRTGIPIAEIST